MSAQQRNQPSWWRQPAMLVCVCGLRALAGEPPEAPRARLIDRAVASISSTSSSRREACLADRRRSCDDLTFEGIVITQSQLEFEARVLLIDAGGIAAAFAPLDQQVLEASLRAVIDQRLALLEANKLEAYPIEPGELEKSIVRFRERFESEARFAQFLENHEATLDDLAEVLRRSLGAQRALEGKLRLRAQVSESDARLWRSAHPDMADVSLEQVRAMLVQQKFGELVKKELAEQRRIVDVRLLGPFAPKHR
jgi:hypothetical protein